ncbi:MAG: PqqD family protein [Candidatus Saganbacteria bacterium]|nr:PqqD family protein [Candidatus Saganbacteria bacterium]
MNLALDSICIPSDKIVAREIEGELIIVPLVSGIGDMEDELFTLNETGREIWKRLDGKKNLNNITDELTNEFKAPREEIEKDVLGLTEELIKRQMIAVASAA